MRAVIDTNVVVSSLLNRFGPPAQVLTLVVLRQTTILYDDRIYAEYREVLRRKEFPFETNDVDSLLMLVETEGEYASGVPLPIVLPDRRDLPFLEVAVAGMADCLVTGNEKHFKPTKGRHSVRIVTPAAFVRAFIH